MLEEILSSLALSPVKQRSTLDFPKSPVKSGRWKKNKLRKPESVKKFLTALFYLGKHPKILWNTLGSDLGSFKKFVLLI